ncbi:T9SS type A sorting domain-containing protein [Fulvitalea axinellae]
MRFHKQIIIFTLSCFVSLGAVAQNPDNEGIQNIQSNNPFYPIPSNGSGVNIWFWTSGDGNWNDSNMWRKGSISSSGYFTKNSSNTKGAPGENDIAIFYNCGSWPEVNVSTQVKCRRIVLSSGSWYPTSTDNVELRIQNGGQLEVSDGIFVDFGINTAIRSNSLSRSDAFLYLENGSTLITGSLISEKLNGEKKSPFFDDNGSRSHIVCDPGSKIIFRPRDDDDDIPETKTLYLPPVRNGSHSWSGGESGSGYGTLELRKGGEDCVDIKSIDEGTTSETFYIKSKLYIDECVTLTVDEPIKMLPGSTVENNGTIINPEKITENNNQVIFEMYFTGEEENIVVDNSLMTYFFDNVSITENLILKNAKRLVVRGAPIKIKSGPGKMGFVYPDGNFLDSDNDITFELGEGVTAPFEIERYYEPRADGVLRKKNWYTLGALTKNQTFETWANSVYAGIFGSSSTLMTYSESKYAKNGNGHWSFITDWSTSLPQPGLAIANYGYVEGETPSLQKGKGNGIVKADGSIFYSEIGEVYLNEKINVPLYFSDEDGSQSDDKASRNGYNCLANPYPFPLSWKRLRQEFSSSGSSNYSLFRNSLITWESSTGMYTLYASLNDVSIAINNSVLPKRDDKHNTNISIAPGQAFFIKTKVDDDAANENSFEGDGEATLELSPEMRYKAEEGGDPNVVTKNVRSASNAEYELFRINLEQDGKPLMQAVNVFSDDSSPDFDEEEDIYMPPFISRSISTSTGLDDKTPIGINVMPYPEEEKRLRLILNGVNPGTYGLRIHDTGTFFKDKEVFIYDTVTDTKTSMDDGTYTFELGKDKNELKDRFQIILDTRLYVQDIKLTADDTLHAPLASLVTVPIKASGLKNIHAFETTLSWDSDKLNLKETSSDHFHFDEIEKNGTLKILYNKNENLTLGINDTLALVSFELKAQEAVINITDTKTKALANDGKTYLEEPSADISTKILEMPKTTLDLQVIPFRTSAPEKVAFSVKDNNSETQYISTNGEVTHHSSYAGREVLVEAKKIENTDYSYISVGDLLKAREYILQEFLLPNIFSDAQLDVNEDGKVSTMDIQAMRRIILGLDEYFVEKNESAWRILPDKNITSKTFEYQGIDSEVELELKKENNKAFFWAIKKGDAYSSDQQQRKGDKTIKILYNTKEKNEGKLVTISTETLEPLKGMQFTLKWDPALYHLKHYQFNSEVQGQVNERLIEKGELPILWTSDSGTTPDNFIELEFSKKSTNTSELDFGLSSSTMENVAFDESMNELLIGLQKTNLPPSTSVHVYPNPVSDIVNFVVNLANASKASVSIINAQGQTVLNSSSEHHSKQHNISLNRIDLPNGIYLYKVKSVGQSFTGKVIFF